MKAIIPWITILVLTGTHLRIRAKGDIQAFTMDWLVIVQILVSMISLAIGFLIIAKRRHLGLGLKFFIFLLIGTILSAIFSGFPQKVFGYWILLAGSGLLTFGIVYDEKSTFEFGEGAVLNVPRRERVP